MTQQFKQFVYCNDNSSINNPNNLTADQLVQGNIFSEFTPLLQLGIQAPPGTKFYVNGSQTPAIVGFSGLFDIDLSNGGSILSLNFDEQSVSYIQSNNSAMLIVDLVYQAGGV